MLRRLVLITLGCLFLVAPGQAATFAGGAPGMPPIAEVSPFTLAGTTYVSTGYTYACVQIDGQFYCPASPIASRQPDVLWLRNYAGVYGGADVDGRTVLTVHGENKNTEDADGAREHNTVTPDTSCWSGTVPGSGYEDCWRDYFAFSSVMVDGVNLGPVVWPAAAYLKADGSLASNGVRHPTALVYHGYLWVYYLDCSPTVNGIAVARSPVSAHGAPGSFETWTGDGWQPSLPAGFTAADASLYLAERGPDAARIADTGWFAVKQVGAERFVALTYGWLPDGEFGTELSTSTDLVHWTAGETLWAAPNYIEAQPRYPRPLSDHTAVGEVDGQVVLRAW